jgi:Tol biopolymer transport system component
LPTIEVGCQGISWLRKSEVYDLRDDLGERGVGMASMRIKLVVSLAIPAFALAVGMWAAAPASAVWPGANGKIVFFKFAFTSPTTISGQIFSVNRDGTGETDLSAAGGGADQVDIQPSVSPNGRKIAFVRFDPSTGSAQLWVMNFNGSGQTDVSNDAKVASESGPAWTSDGTQLLFVKQLPGSFPGNFGAPAGGQIRIRNADGGGTPTQLTNGLHDANPAMSPNGRMIAFSRPVSGGARELWVMNANGNGQTDLGQPGAKPDWSPDSTRLVYGQAGAGGISVLHISDPSSATLLRAGPVEAPVFSPDGSQIAFVDCSKTGVIGDNCQIAAMSATGQNGHDITNEPTLSDQKPDWQAQVTQNSQGENTNPGGQGQNNNNQ